MRRFREALRLLEAKRYPEARSLLELLIRENPSDPDLLYNLGMLYSEQGEPDKAIELLTRCVEVAPDHANAYVALGYARYLKGDYTAAKADLMHALCLDPDNPYALRNLGGICGKLQNHREALAYLEKAAKILPNDPQTICGLGHAYLGCGELDRADETLRRVLRLPAPPHIIELAKSDLRELASTTFKAKGLRPDAVFYCLDALGRFEKEGLSRTREIAFEIALLGRSGLDVNDPDRKYQLRTLEGRYSGLQLVCFMYVGFKKIDQAVDIGFDLDSEFRAAQELHERGTNGNA